MLSKFSASAKLYLLICITVISIVGLGIYGIYDLEEMNNNTQTLYADRVLPFQQLSHVRYEYIAEILPMAQKVKDHLITADEAIRRLKNARVIINKNWHDYKLTYLTPEETLLVKQTELLKQQADIASEDLIRLLTEKNQQAIYQVAQTKTLPDPAPLTLNVTRLMDLQVRVGKQIYDANKEIYRSTSKRFFLLIALFLVILLSLSIYIIKNIKTLINKILNNNNLIKESEERYRSLFEQASDAIYVANFSGNFTQVNDSMCKMVGYSREELLTMKVENLLNADLLMLNPMMYNKVEPGTTVTGERKFVHKTGDILDIEINGKKFADDRVLVMFRDITKRKEMEAELRKAELKFRTLADKSMVGIYILQKGRFIYVNPRFAEIFGYTPKEVTDFSDCVDALIHPDHKPIAYGNVLNRINGELASVHYEALGIKKDGSTNWVEFYGSMAILEGEPTIIGSMIDIKERKRAEEELKSSEQKYRLLFESNPVPLWIVAKDDLSVLAANEAAAKLYGYTKEELLAMNVKRLRPPEDWEKQIENYKKDSSGSTDFGIVRHIKKDGTLIYVNTISQDIMFEGRFVRLSSTNDVTEKLKAEELLKKTEANLQTILNTTDTSYALLDRNLNVLEYNHQALTFAKHEFNFDPENGDNLFEHLPESRRDVFLDNIQDVFKGNTIGYEVVYDHSDDQQLWYYIRMFPISNKQNEILGLVIAITDITERKSAEQHLQLAYERTKKHIAFIKEMNWKQSHILRSPLANLKGLVTILKSDPSDDEVLNFINSELERMDTVFLEMDRDSSKDDMNY